ncbi:unnamed protein product [Prorocentrum cordatum]|uniref:Uncharacterized protein n=1 Tax=Prorocentrum cordatum TaxID=2364126 RepID=A0ABN9TNE1_9DINO|nr:unnamed protein product [Polarella glacialis]
MLRHVVQPSVVTFNTLITWGLAGALFWELRRAALQPTARTYNASLVACGHAQNWERALCHLAEMRAQGVAPDRETRALVLRTLAAGLEARQALQREAVMQVLYEDFAFAGGLDDGSPAAQAPPAHARRP